MGQCVVLWMFFVVPGELGALEAVYVVLVRVVGFPAAAGLALALVRRVRSLTLAGAGLVLFAWVGESTSSQSRP